MRPFQRYVYGVSEEGERVQFTHDSRGNTHIDEDNLSVIVINPDVSRVGPTSVKLTVWVGYEDEQVPATKVYHFKNGVDTAAVLVWLNDDFDADEDDSDEEDDDWEYRRCCHRSPSDSPWRTRRI